MRTPFRKNKIASLLLAALLLAGAALSFAQAPSGIPDTAKLVRELAAISGLTERKPVPVNHISRDELRHYLDRKIDKEVKVEEIRAEEILLKKLGLVPPISICARKPWIC